MLSARQLLQHIEENIAAEEVKLPTLPAPGATVIDANPGNHFCQTLLRLSS
jgi:hypothetical protein